MLITIVELDSGEQEFFDRPADGFLWARQQERNRPKSVDYVMVADTDTDDMSVYKGLTLLNLIRSLDISGWINGECNLPPNRR